MTVSSMLSVEREVPLEEIERRAWQLLRARGYDARLDAIHGTRWGVWTCQIVTAHGNPIPGGLGAGKGQGPHARVGALCEAIEHLVTQSPSCRTRLRRAGDVVSSVAGDPIAPFLAEQPDASLACAQYASLIDGTRRDIPIALSVPAYLHDQHRHDTFDYGPLSPYSTNSGTALGATPAEALLHALNEVIERDALSLLLCHAFLGHGYQPVLIDPASLPGDLAGLFEYVHDVVGSPIHLVDITSDLAVPTVLAYVPPQRGRAKHGRGLGTSLRQHHAIYRALAELLQLEMVDGVTCPDRLQHLEDIDPILLRCAEFDLSPYLRHATCRPYRQSGGLGSVGSQLAAVVGLVRSRGYTPYYRAADTGSDDLAVVHVVIPGLERIMTLLNGYPALPGSRGLDTLRHPGASA